MKHRITLIPGDGIGPEVSAAAVRCIEATGIKVEWEEVIAGSGALEKTGELLPASVLDSIRRNKVCLKGPMTTPVGSGFRSVNVAIRQALDLYACVRPARTYPGTRSRYENIDLVIFRENTEDLYAGIEFEQGLPETRELIARIEKFTKKSIRPDSGISIKPISISATQRLARFAFEYAIKNGRKKITAVHKANIMKFTDGLFLKTVRQVAAEYEGRIAFEDAIVDNMSMQLVLRPQLYDCLLLPNLYGDILSDLCAGLIGGLGIAPGANIGDGIAVFEAVHGSAPKYKGMNRVNPAAMILSGVLMLKYIGEEKAARALDLALTSVLAEGKNVTYDLKAERDDPTAVGTKEMATAVISALTLNP